MKKRLLTILILALFLLCLSACKGETEPTTDDSSSSQGESALTEANVKSVMADILPGAAKVYSNILYGGYSAGEYTEDAVRVVNEINYAPVADSDFDTMAKLKAEAEKYYTTSYAEETLYLVLTGNFPIYREIDGKLYINVDGGGGGGYTYLTDTATLVSSENNTFVVSVDCLDNYETKYTATLSFVSENDQLKINAAEYK